MSKIGLYKDEPTNLIKTKRWIINFRIEKDFIKPLYETFITPDNYLTHQYSFPFLSIWILDCEKTFNG